MLLLLFRWHANLKKSNKATTVQRRKIKATQISHPGYAKNDAFWLIFYLDIFLCLFMHINGCEHFTQIKQYIECTAFPLRYMSWAYFQVNKYGSMPLCLLNFEYFILWIHCYLVRPFFNYWTFKLRKSVYGHICPYLL